MVTGILVCVLGVFFLGVILVSLARGLKSVDKRRGGGDTLSIPSGETPMGYADAPNDPSASHAYTPDHPSPHGMADACSPSDTTSGHHSSFDACSFDHGGGGFDGGGHH